MRRKKPEIQVQVKCAYCGSMTETFVSSYPDYLNFCRIHTPGKEPEKDCMTDYYKEKKNVQKEKKEKGLFTQEKVGIQKEEIKLTDRHTAIKKLDELKQFLKDKKRPSSNYTPLKRI